MFFKCFFIFDHNRTRSFDNVIFLFFFVISRSSFVESKKFTRAFFKNSMLIKLNFLFLEFISSLIFKMFYFTSKLILINDFFSSFLSFTKMNWSILSFLSMLSKSFESSIKFVAYFSMIFWTSFLLMKTFELFYSIEQNEYFVCLVQNWIYLFCFSCHYCHSNHQ